jgi:hypothetical protein
MSPRTRRLLPWSIVLAALVAVLATASLATAGTNAPTAPTAQRHYPPEVRRAFITSCTRTAKAVAGSRLTRSQARQYCTSALSCIERHLTLRQFERVVQNMQAGRRNPNAHFLTSCERAAARKVVGGG